MLAALARLSDQISAQRAATAAERAVLERSAVKGLAFEQQAVAAVTELAGAFGDVTDAVGHQAGMSGSRVGDVLVDVATDDTAATGPGTASVRYALEVKDRRLGLRATLDELAAVRRNRDAAAAIAVFSRPEHAPIRAPFREFGDCAIVVLDKDDPDPAALQLACAWARWVEPPRVSCRA